MTKRRVVITGMGALSPLGLDVDSSWAAIRSGQSGVDTITRFDTEGLATTIAAMVKNFDPNLALSPKEQKKCDLFVQYGLEAARQAMLDSGLEMTEALSVRAGTAFGAGIGGLKWIEDNHDQMVNRGPRRVSPFFIPGSIINMSPGLISMKHNLRGPIVSAVSACATGVHNIGLAARMIAYGDADVMLAGGVETTNSKLTVSGFSQMKALSKRNDAPTQASRPFDRDRDGFVVGEGAAAMVLEEYEHAKARGANIFAEVTGFGMSADAYHMTMTCLDGNGASRCMDAALKDAGLNPNDIAYVNAHGTSTAADVTETLAIKTTFGQHAYDLAVSSTKSMTGHLLGAAGALESVICVKAMQDGLMPPTINLDHPAEGCDLNYVPHSAQEKELYHTMCNSFGFGGANACLVFSKV